MRFHKRPYRRILVPLLALFACAVFVWQLGSRPVLFHSRLLATAADRSCGDYPNGGAGTPILNPFRSSAPERVADAFLRAASSAQCLPELGERTCKFLAQHPFQAHSWRPVDRYDSGEYVMVIYAAYFQRGRNGCSLFSVQLRRNGATWKVSGFGSGALRAADVME